MKTTFPEVFPADEHNMALLANVHPSEWINPDGAGRYNLVVIGAGTAGLVSAAGAAGLGARVALIEGHLMGGDCLNVGCVPSKTLIRAGRAAADLRRMKDFGISVPEGVQIDFGKVMERVRRVRAGISPHDSARRFSEDLGIDVFLGEAQFTGRDTVEVSGTELHFERAIIATGACAAVPEIPGLAKAGFLSNENVFNLTEMPIRLAVLGGGPIGCELAQAFARLGSSVVIIERGEHFLPREDADAVAILRKAFEEDGVDIRLGSKLDRVELREGTKVLHISDTGGETTIEADELLVGVGRIPNVQGLQLEKAGVAFGHRGVEVDDYFRTTNPKIYAAGDVCSPFKFTHAADFMARAVIQNALFGLAFKKKASSLNIPWCTYTDPEIAHVGLYEHEAAEKGREITTFRVPMVDVDRAITDGEEEGFVKIHVQKGSDEILGATIVARHAGEMISEITTAMASRMGLGSLASVIHPYPTQTDAIRRAGDLYNHTRLTEGRAGILKRYFSWRR